MIRCNLEVRFRVNLKSADFMILGISGSRDRSDLGILTHRDRDPSGSGPLRIMTLWIWTPPDHDPSDLRQVMTPVRGLDPLDLVMNRVITPKLVIL